MSQGNSAYNILSSLLPQIDDANNTTEYTDDSVEYVGTWTRTRSAGIVRQLVVLASSELTGLGGTFVFEYSADGITANISESREITTFSTVRDFDLLNSGAYFRVRFTPDRTVTASEFIWITTTHRTQDDGVFARLGNQEIEEQNAAMGQVFAYAKSFGLDGNSASKRLGGLDPSNYSQTPLGISGTYTGDYRDTSSYQSALVFVLSDVELDSAVVRWSPDGATSRAGLIGTSEIAVSETGGFYIYLSVLTTFVDRYMRMELVNGTTATALFEADIWLYETGFPGSFAGLSSNLSSLSTALLTRSVFAGVDPDDSFKNQQIQGRHSANSVNGRSVTDAAFTSGSDVLTSATARFTAADVGLDISGPPEIPAATTIATVTDGTEITMSANATGTDTGAAVDIGTLLGPAEIWTGEWLEWQDKYVGTVTEVDSDVDGTFYIDFSTNSAPEDDVDNDIAASLAIPIIGTDIYTPRTTPLQSRWVRMRYVNGASAQTEFAVDTAFITNPVPDVLETLSTDPQDRFIAGIEKVIPYAADIDSPETYPRVYQKNGGLQQTIVDHQVSTPIRAVSTLSTFRSQVTNTGAVALPSAALSDRATVRYQNHSDTFTIWFSEAEAKLTGTADGIPPLQSVELDLDEGEQVFFRLAGSGGTINTFSAFADITDSNSGVTTPDNVFASDDTYAVLGDEADTATWSGFENDLPGSPLDNIIDVKIKAEVSRPNTPATQVVTFDGVDTATGGNAGSRTVTGITADTGALYIVTIARHNVAAAISSITNTMGFTGAVEIEDVNNSGESRTSMYRMTGTPTGDGTITANFSTGSNHDCMTVSRYSGVDLASPVEASDTFSTTTGGSYTGTLAGTENGMVVVGMGMELTDIATANNGATIQVGPGFGSTTNNDQASALTTQPVTVTGSQTWSGSMDTGTYGSNDDITAAAVALTPAATDDPSGTISYEILGVPGATSLTVAPSSATDATVEVDITSDRSWLHTDLTDLTIIAVLDSDSGLDLQIDAIWLEIEESSDIDLAVISGSQVGGIV